MNPPRQVALLLVATQFLTRIPVGSASEFQPQWLSQSLRYFPLVGGLVGLANVAVWWLASHWCPPAVTVGLMLAASLLITGAFHEDGFADTCDGLGGGTTRERALTIMKDSRIGAYGAIGLVVLFGLKWSALAELPTYAFALVVVAAHVVSRWYAIGLVWALPYARIEGEGKSRAFDGGLSLAQWILAGAIGVCAVAIPAVWFWPLSEPLERALAVGFAGAGGSAAMAGVYFRQRIGGYTGDCLGATQQFSELTFLLAALAVLRAAATLAA